MSEAVSKIEKVAWFSDFLSQYGLLILSVLALIWLFTEAVIFCTRCRTYECGIADEVVTAHLKRIRFVFVELGLILTINMLAATVLSPYWLLPVLLCVMASQVHLLARSRELENFYNHVGNCPVLSRGKKVNIDSTRRIIKEATESLIAARESLEQQRQDTSKIESV